MMMLVMLATLVVLVAAMMIVVVVVAVISVTAFRRGDPAGSGLRRVSAGKRTTASSPTCPAHGKLIS